MVLQLSSQDTDLFGNVIVKHINIRIFDLLARCNYILNPPCSSHCQVITGSCDEAL